MSNTVAFVLGLFIILLIVGDVVLFESANLVFLGKKMFELIEWMAFWR